MIRQMRIVFRPSEAARAMLRLWQASQLTGWPTGWRALGDSLLEVVGRARQEIRQVKESLEALEALELVDLHREAEEGDSLGMQACTLHVDLEALLDDPRRGERSIRELYRLLTLLQRTETYDRSVKVGGKHRPWIEAMSELRDQARAHGLKLEAPVERLERMDRAEERPAFDDWDDGGDDEEDEEEDWADEGWEEDEEALTEAERFFLEAANLAWPCTPEDVKLASRRVARRFHPDHQDGDPEAARDFIRARRGYERLVKRLLG